MENKFIDSLVITDELVRKTAEVTGDYNPIHLDDEYAKKSRYKKRIAHGVVLVGFISKVLGTKFPGEGTILFKQEFKYRKPVYIGDEIVTAFTMKLIKENKYEVRCICYNKNEEVVLESISMVLWK